MKKIIHIDMDAFFASVEQRDNPELKGKPIAVGGSSERGVVAAASYEARKFGVRSAMSSFKAKQICPQLIFVKHRFDVYKKVSSQIMEIFKSYTDLVEPLSLDEAYLDVTENNFGMKSATLIAQEIRSKIFEKTQLTASAGISFNKFLAKVASDLNKPNGYAVITPAQADQFIDNLEIDKFYGIGKKTSEKLRKEGIFFGKDIKKIELYKLEKKFGKLGVHLYHIVRGNDQRKVKPNRIRKSIGCETTLNQNVIENQKVIELSNQLAIELENRLKTKNIKGKTLTVKLKFEDFEQITRSNTVNFFFGKQNEIKEIAKVLLMEEFPLPKPIRLIGLQISNLNTEPENQKFEGQLKIPYPNF